MVSFVVAMLNVFLYGEVDMIIVISLAIIVTMGFSTAYAILEISNE